MKVVLMCGGAGVRFDQLFPKPMNLIHGRPMIFYTIDSLGVHLDELHVFYLHELDAYGFRPLLINQYPHLRFHFYPIPYQTRGPVESMLLGLKTFPYEDDAILFLDNDNVYEGWEIPSCPIGNHLLYTDHRTPLHHYSFVEVDGDHVTQVKERVPISTWIGAGGYGFASKAVAVKYGTMVMNETIGEEPYMSFVFQRLLQDGETVQGIYLPGHFSIGTPSDILQHEDRLQKRTLTFVFDLDNTIVTYPTEYKDYRTVEPYPPIVEWMRHLHREGHRIIIHTARKMVSCGGDVEEVKRQVGDITIESLRRFDIPYDELIFGKPYGDVYIDDKAYNPFDHSLRQQLGFYHHDHLPSSSHFPTNRYHRIVRRDKHTILKLGTGLEGEQFFYRQVASSAVLAPLFPQLKQSISPNCLALEYLRGTPLNQIYSEGLLQPALFTELLSTVKRIHSTPFDDGVELSDEVVCLHYLEKFEERSRRVDDFPFTDREEVYHHVKQFITEWVTGLSDRPVESIIHGDCWFSNILYSARRFYFLDMRGKIHHTLTVKGHALYDWAKLYQSVVGLDHIIHYNENIPLSIREPIEAVFWEHCPYPVDEVLGMTAYLIYNTFHAYPPDFEATKRQLIWELVKELWIPK